MIHVTRRLTAKNRDQLRNPMLSNRVWATFTFYLYGVFLVSEVGRLYGSKWMDVMWQWTARMTYNAWYNWVD